VARVRGEEGQTILLVTLSMTVLLGFMGLAVDMGYLRYVERHMRTAADAAALSGAEAILYLNNSGGYVGAGKADAAKNGFSDGANGVTVNMYNPPNDGPHTCANDPANCNHYVEATVSQSQPTFFAKIFNVNSVALSARAVAWEGVVNHDCMYALDPTSDHAFDVQSSTLNAPNCSIVVDSDSPNGAYKAQGNACVTALNIAVVGGDQWDNECTEPTTGVQPPVSDPLAGVPAPSVGSCPNPPPALPAGCGFQSPDGPTECTATASSTALQPGTYCNGIVVKPSSYTLTFGAGTYVLNGGGLTVSATDVTGNGVTFYNTVSAATSYEAINFTGGSSTTLTAPTSGSLDGILFFQDRNLPAGDTGPSGPQNTISGTSSTTITGAFYFPTTNLTISGGSSVNPFKATAVIVADTISINGGSNVTIGASPSGQTPTLSVALVE